MRKRGKGKKGKDSRYFSYIVAFLILVLAFLVLLYFGFKGFTGESVLGSGYLNDCGKLYNTGYGYFLSGDLNFYGNGSCLRISAGNVTLDCQGKKITLRGSAGSLQEGASTIPRSGIFINGSNPNIKNCFINGDINSGYGIYLEGVEEGIFSNNTVNNSRTGIYGGYVKGLVFMLNKVIDNKEGLRFFNSIQIIVENNLIKNNSEYGAEVLNDINTGLLNNSFECNGQDVYSYSSSQLEVSSNSFSAEDCDGKFKGLVLESTNQSKTFYNLFIGKREAMSLINSFNNEIKWNQLINNTIGFSFDAKSKSNSLEANIMDNKFDMNISDIGLSENSLQNNDYINSLYLNGNNKYGHSPGLDRMSPEHFSVSAWIRRDFLPEGKSGIINLFGKGALFIYLDSSGRYHAFVNVSNGTSRLSNDLIIGKANDGNWHNIGLVYDNSSSTVNAYFDGKLNASFSFNNGAGGYGIAKMDDSLFIGVESKNRTASANNSFFKGFFDDVKIYNLSLSQDDFAQIANSGRMVNYSLPNQGLIAWYGFDREDRGLNNLGNFNSLSIKTYNPELVYAGNLEEEVVDVNLENLINGHFLYLSEGQELRVRYGNTHYYLFFAGLDESNNALFLANPVAEEIEVPFGTGTKIDLNDDFVYDLLFYFSEIKEEGTIGVFLKLISESISSQSRNRSFDNFGEIGEDGPDPDSDPEDIFNIELEEDEPLDLEKKNKIAEYVSIFVLGTIILAALIILTLIGYEIYRSRSGSGSGGNLPKKFPAYDASVKDSF